MKTLRFFAFATLSLVSFAACSSAPLDETETGDAPLTDKELLTENKPFYWAETSYEDYRAVATEIGLPVYDNLPDDHRLSQRFQAWADVIHAAVQELVLKNTTNSFVNTFFLPVVAHQYVL